MSGDDIRFLMQSPGISVDDYNNDGRQDIRLTASDKQYLLLSRDDEQYESVENKTSGLEEKVKPLYAKNVSWKELAESIDDQLRIVLRDREYV